MVTEFSEEFIKVLKETMARGTSFQELLKLMLDNRAQTDELFAKTYAKANKSLEKCWMYVTNEARKKADKNVACLDCFDVLGLAVHYYDEDSLDDELEDKVPVSKASATKDKTTTFVPYKPTVKKETKNPLCKQLSLFDDID